ncbi:hypothetical protein [Bacillus thuringiensis]|uniref:hypothetical protein n=1 Tax=Bacillus thuringiensis TaxID=1428 RepID=UPI00403E3530
MIDKYIECKEIHTILMDFGFKRKFEEGNEYHWFNEDYISTKGCRFSFGYNLEDVASPYEIKRKYIFLEEGTKTICKVSTAAGCSYADLNMHNEVVKKIHQEFGGSIYNFDNYNVGEGAYIQNTLQQLNRTEIACGVTYSYFLKSITIIETLIEDVNLSFWNSEDNFYYKNSHNIPLLRNNVLVPFFISVLETFLKTFLTRFLETNENPFNGTFSQKNNFSNSVPKDVLAREKTVVNLELKRYSFQNFKSANKAYKVYLNFDLFELLHQIVIYEGEESTIISVLNEMISTRHEIIHEANIKTELDKRKMKKYHYFLDFFGSLFIKTFMKKYKLRLLLEEELR